MTFTVARSRPSSAASPRCRSATSRPTSISSGYKASTVAPVSARTFRSNGLKTPPIASTDPELGGFAAAPDVQSLRDLRAGEGPGDGGGLLVEPGHGRREGPAGDPPR